MRSGVFTGVALAALASTAVADPLWDGWSVNVQVDNDMFDYVGPHTDRYYTHGTQFAVVSPPIRGESLPFATRLRLVKPEDEVRAGVVFGQNIYTPESLTITDLDPRDRPYAGWLYVGPTVVSKTASELNALELQVGLVGPSALGHVAQNKVHDLIEAARFEGWSDQLRDEVAFVLMGERMWAPEVLAGSETGGWALDQTDHAGFAVGTLKTSLSLGTTFRIGRGMDGDFGAPRIRPAPSGAAFFRNERDWAGYVFAGGEARLVARDIFLDGNTFQDSPRTDKRPLVFEAQAGVSVRWKLFRFSYAHVWRSEEFVGQRGNQEFGAFSISLTPGGGLTREP